MLWVDVLNRALDWRDSGDLEREPHAARVARVFDTAALQNAQARVRLLRRVFASQYLDAPLPHPELDLVNQWLAAVTLQVTPSPSAPGRLDLVTARSPGAPPQPNENALSSALVQVLAHGRASMTAVHRCHGVLRNRRIKDAMQATDWPVELEARFAHVAGIAPLLRDGTWHQCPRLVVSERGSRYCSKACSNAHFVARKTQTDPAYFAAKQKRYRSRREAGPAAGAARVDRGAFVYMD